MKIGIVGLPNVGKSTLFNAMTGAGAAAENYPFCTIDSNIGVVGVPDARLDVLSEMYDTLKTVPTAIEFVDIAGLVKGAGKGEGLGNRFLSNIRSVNAMLHVVRCFDDVNVTHVEGSVDPARDVETIRYELIFSDLEILERRLAALNKSASRAPGDVAARAALVRAYEDLSAEKFPLRSEYENEQWEILEASDLLTTKPILYAANVAEEDAGQGNAHVDALREYLRATEPNSELVIVSAAIENEISQLPPDEREAFLGELGLGESGLDRIARSGYDMLGLITFFTAGKKECRAWTITKGTRAPQAAGKIHTDFERGFIRAEVTKYDKLIEAGSDVRAKEMAYTRVEGKEYVVEDGDVVFFRFNV